MNNLDDLRSPISFLESALQHIPCRDVLENEAAWWEEEGRAISEAIDRRGTPWMRMFDRFGTRTDQILFPPDYWRMLKRGYRSGVVWRAFEEKSLIPSCLLIYNDSFYDPGVCCPYAVSLATACSLSKYGNPEWQERFLPQLLRRDDSVWQGATWMTEIKGGSDLGASIETIARQFHGRWSLTGDKYFASNVGAELAVVAARPEGAPQNVHGLALFLVPRRREDGQLNYFVRRIKDKIATRSVPTGEVQLQDSEAYLLGLSGSGAGIYIILEVLNLSRVANSMVSVATAQHSIALALDFARRRVAFGKVIADHPLLRRQFEQRREECRAAFALAWEAVQLLNEVWLERPPYSERYHLFRLVAHLAKYWTAEFAVQTAKWNMEVHGGLGVLTEYGVERQLREAMILAIWEGTPQRHILDGIEVMEKKQAHRQLLQRLAAFVPTDRLQEMKARIDQHLSLPKEQKEANAEEFFNALASFTANALKAGLLEARNGKPSA